MPKQKKQPLVTKEWLAERVKLNPAYTVGRALVALFNRQTEAEQATNTTRIHNNAGFTAQDARIGCIAAKTFLKNGTLLDWQLKAWVMPNKQGLPRIVKYAKQLNKIAEQKATR